MPFSYWKTSSSGLLKTAAIGNAGSSEEPYFAPSTCRRTKAVVALADETV
jgi:hypothetical protein